MKARIRIYLRIEARMLLLLLLTISSTVSATTYYIDSNGNDNTGNGSSASPWKTLYKACNSVTTSGDIIHVNAGTYTENTTCILRVGVSIEGAGNTSVITRTSSSEWTPIIDGESSTATNGNQSISYLKFDGNSRAVAQALWIAGRHNVRIHHCTFVDFNYLAIVWTGIGGSEETAPTTYMTGSEFYNNTVTNCAGYGDGWYRGALFIGGHDGMLIHDNTMIETGRAAGTQGWPIKNWANGGWLKGCKIYRNHLEKTDCSVWDFCIESLWVFGMEIYDNTIIGAIDLNNQEKGTYDYAVYIHNNTIGPAAHGAYGCSGIILEYQNDGIIIKYNRIKNCSPPIKFTPRDQNTQNFDLSYNIIENCANTAGYYGGIRFISSSGITISHFYVQNNVFTGNAANNPLYAITIDSEGGTYTGNDFRIINNIFVNFSMSYLYLSRAGYVSNLNVENNIIYSCGNNNLPSYTGTPLNYTYLNNKIGSNPLFASSTDYRLQSGSPAIRAGKNIGMSLDYEGNTVADTPSIGAYEYGSTPPPTAIPVYISSVIENATPNILTMNFSLSLANIRPANSDFIVMVNSVARPVNLVTISGNKVVLTLTAPVVYGDVITVSYNKPANNPLQTVSGGQANSIIGQNVTNNCHSPSPVYISSVIETATPSVLEMAYSLSLARIIPSGYAFNVMVNSVRRYVNSVEISGNKVFLTLTDPVGIKDVVTVSYAQVAINPLQTVLGGQATSILNKPVTNNVGQKSEQTQITMLIYPNPAQNYFNVSISSDSDSDIYLLRITDLAGHVHYEANVPVGTTNIPTSNILGSGIYVAELIKQGFTVGSQIIIITN